MALYDFQKDAIKQLMAGKHFIVAGCGAGKTAMALIWAKQKCEQTGKYKVLVVTTASKSKTGDFEQEDKEWNGDSERRFMAVISWHKLKAWTNENLARCNEFVIIFDEVQRAKAGVSSGMGSSFLKITKMNNDWAGFTGTPGDT